MVLKKDLINRISESSGFLKKDVEELIDSFVAVLEKTLAEGESIKLVGLGTFIVKESKPQYRDVRTGEVKEAPTRKLVKFRISQTLRDCLK